MKMIYFLFAFTGLFLWKCQAFKTNGKTADNLNQELQLNLNQTLPLISDNKKELGKITFTHLAESRCPANAMCVRQGAAVTTFAIQTNNDVTQKVRLFIGDFMPDDARRRRNRTADTVMVQLKDKNTFHLILKEVGPYPGTSTETPKAIIVIKKA